MYALIYDPNGSCHDFVKSSTSFCTTVAYKHNFGVCSLCFLNYFTIIPNAYRAKSLLPLSQSYRLYNVQEVKWLAQYFTRITESEKRQVSYLQTGPLDESVF